uniref:Transcriptional regulator MraZ n=1 Tax=mine drainage metagenome TaxID=410659 RepID=E6QKP4_9ZZZZ
MFRGSYEAKVDEKGRFKLPAGFIKLIQQKQYGSEYFITSFDGQIGEIWPLSEWEKKEAEWALIPDESREKQRFLDQVNFYGQQVEIDGQDRLLVPQRLRARAGLVGEVDILGAGRYMKIANHQVMQRRVEAESRNGQDALPGVSIAEAMDFMAGQSRLSQSKQERS